MINQRIWTRNYAHIRIYRKILFIFKSKKSNQTILLCVLIINWNIFRTSHFDNSINQNWSYDETFISEIFQSVQCFSIQVYKGFASINLIFFWIFNFSICVHIKVHSSCFIFCGKLINDKLIVIYKYLNLKNIVNDLANKIRFM